MKRKFYLFQAIAIAIYAATAGSSLAVTTTLTSGNWQGGAWDNGQPGVGDDAIIDGSVTANGTVDSWSGSLTINAGATLSVLGTSADFMATGGAADINLDGILGNNFKSQTITSNFALSGGGRFNIAGNSSWNQDQRFSGVFSGSGGFTIKGGNHAGMRFLNTNTFTGGLTIETQAQRFGVEFAATGAAGAGDVTVQGNADGTGQGAVIIVNALNPFDPSATLTLNCNGYDNSSGGFGPFTRFLGTAIRIEMLNDAEVAGLIIDNVPMPSGTYTAASGDWISGTGTLTVTSGTVDTTPPTLLPSDIVDNKMGEPIFESELVTYTLTFSEPMNGASIGVDDFENAGSPAATIQSVSTSGASVEVVVLPGGDGTLQLQVKAAAELLDVASNPLDTTSPITDDTTITVKPGLATSTVTTLTADGNWVGGIWDMGEPGLQFDAVIAPGVTGTATGSVTAWGATGGSGGKLTISAGSTLNVAGTDAEFIAVEGAKTIDLTGVLLNNWKSQTVASDFVLSGGGRFNITGNSSWNQDQLFTGVFSGSGGFTIKGGNHAGMRFLNTNTFTDGLTIEQQAQRFGVEFGATGAAGAGDVTVEGDASGSGQGAVIVVNAPDPFDPNATLTLNSNGFDNSSGGFGPFTRFLGTQIRIEMLDNATVGALIIDNVAMPAGDYTDASGDWISGSGTLKVSGDLGTGFKITAFNYSPGDETVTLTWESKPTDKYAVKYSHDMKEWGSDLDDGIAADAGDTTTKTFSLVPPNLTDAGRIYFRVERQPAD